MGRERGHGLPLLPLPLHGLSSGLVGLIDQVGGRLEYNLTEIWNLAETLFTVTQDWHHIYYYFLLNTLSFGAYVLQGAGGGFPQYIFVQAVMWQEHGGHVSGEGSWAWADCTKKSLRCFSDGNALDFN